MVIISWNCLNDTWPAHTLHSIEFSTSINADANHVRASSCESVLIHSLEGRFTAWHSSSHICKHAFPERIWPYWWSHNAHVTCVWSRYEAEPRTRITYSVHTMPDRCRSLQQHANMFTRQLLLLFSQPYHLHHKWRWTLIGLVIIQISIETCSIWLLIEQNKQLGAKQHLKHVSGDFLSQNVYVLFVSNHFQMATAESQADCFVFLFFIIKKAVKKIDDLKKYKCCQYLCHCHYFMSFQAHIMFFFLWNIKGEEY